jgi:predicted TIM-barrel enzyme
VRWSLFLLVLCLGCTTASEKSRPALQNGDGIDSLAATGTPAVARLEDALKKLRALSKNTLQLWVVVHVRANKTLDVTGRIDEEKLFADVLASTDAVVKGGGDAIILINARTEMPLYERVIDAVKKAHPDFPLGISALSYGPENLTEGVRLAEKFDAQIVWTEVVPGTEFEFEDAGNAYERGQVTTRAFAQSVMEKAPARMLVSGVHMKYTRNLDGRDFSQSMTYSLGSVDGINITGPKTGVRADVERIRLARQLAGKWPLGLASGVSVENIGPVAQFIDYAIVGTSLKDPENALRTSEERVRALRKKMSELRP